METVFRIVHEESYKVVIYIVSYVIAQSKGNKQVLLVRFQGYGKSPLALLYL